MSKSLYGAEIFDAGTWPAQTGTVTVTTEDIDAIVASFEALGLSRKVPIKAGHNEQQPMTDGKPALGWVDRIWRQGTKLMADFVDMPTVIHEAIRKKLYKTVSIELLRNVQAGTRKIPWVLDAVSLLGADQPAVGTLKDLEALTMSRGTALRASARVAFRRDFQFTNPEARKGMEKHEVDAAIAAALSAQEVKFTSQLNALKTESAQALEAEREKTRKAEVARHRDAIKSKFESAVNKTILPATREQFYKFARVEDDAAVMALKLEDVDAYIKDNADKALMSKSQQQTQQGEGNKDEEGLRADQILANRAIKLCRDRNQDVSKHYFESVQEVLKSDEKLAEAYKYMPDTEYRQAS